jgi:N-acetylmuramoyl-L-alanine amidase
MRVVQVVAGLAVLVSFARTAGADLPTVTYEGRAYVEAFRIAEALGARFDATPDRVYVRAPRNLVVFTRGWARVEIDGKPIVLETPVRVEQGVWLVPGGFLEKVMPRLPVAPPGTVTTRAGASPGPPSAGRSSPKPPDPPRVEKQLAAQSRAPDDPAPSGLKPSSSPRAIESGAPPKAPGTRSGPDVRAAEAGASVASPVEPAPGPGGRPRPSSASANAPATPQPSSSQTAPVLPAALPPAASPPSSPPARAEAPVIAESLRALAPSGPAAAPAPALSGPQIAAVSPTLPPGPRPAAEAQLEDLRLRSYPSFTRVVVETSSPLRYRLETAPLKETRIRLLGLAADPKADEVRDGLVAEVRLERAGADALLRVLFERRTGEAKVTVLTDPHRLLVDFARPTEKGTAGARETYAPLKTLVLDAGHGGHDSGAVGPGGLMEKDLVLDVTRRVARLLEDRAPGLRVVLSRSADYFVSLKDRTSFANRERADLFVSIHANAHRDNAHEGVETYFLSSEATDTGARQVAALENGVVQLERANDKAGRPDVLRTILWDLAQSEFQLESSRLAEVVQDSMTQSLRIPNRGVKQAGFYVLGGAAMPAVLIEIGFVTNHKEERKLKDQKYRDEIAKAIVAGIVEYRRQHDQRFRQVAR